MITKTKKKSKRHKCINCGRVRDEKFMEPFISLEHGVSVRELYPKVNHGRQRWECGDCEENLKSK
jgi:ribosomal protein S27AE